MFTRAIFHRLEQYDVNYQLKSTQVLYIAKHNSLAWRVSLFIFPQPYLQHSLQPYCIPVSSRNVRCCLCLGSCRCLMLACLYFPWPSGSSLSFFKTYFYSVSKSAILYFFLQSEPTPPLVSLHSVLTHKTMPYIGICF